MVRLIIWIVEIIILFLLQTSVFSYFTISGIVPDCLLIFIVAVAFKKGQNKAIILGFVSGLILDLMFNETIGICSIIYMFVAFLAGYTNKIYDRHDYIIPGALVLVGELLYGILYYSATFLLMGKLNLGSYMVNTIIPRVIYTVFAAVLIYPMFLFFEWIISLSEGALSDD